MRSLYAFILLLLCSLASLTLHATTWTAETLPMVHLQDRTRYVCDPDDILADSTVRITDALLARIESEKGIETLVVIARHIKDADPYTLGMDLARRYGIGSRKQNTGLIVIIATEDRKYQILTGRGLEATLPDAICRRIENRIMVPRLKASDLDGAVIGTIRAIDGTVRGDTSLVPDADDAADDGPAAFIGFGIAMIFLAALIFGSVYAGYKSRCPRCKRAQLKVVSRRRVRTDGPMSPWAIETVYRCPHCGYERRDIRRDTPGDGGAGLLLGSMLLGSMLRGGSHGDGSASSGGSFGGGSFGGGGSGGSF